MNLYEQFQAFFNQHWEVVRGGRHAKTASFAAEGKSWELHWQLKGVRGAVDPRARTGPFFSLTLDGVHACLFAFPDGSVQKMLSSPVGPEDAARIISCAIPVAAA